MKVLGMDALLTDQQVFGSCRADSTIAFQLSKYQQLHPPATAKPVPQEMQMRLTVLEQLQLVNLAPRTLVEIQCIVEEASSRFSVDEMQSLI